MSGAIYAAHQRFLAHYGTPRHSGRYPWGSGKDPYQRNKNFISYARKLHDKGLSNKQIAKGMGMTTKEFTARYSIAKDEEMKARMDEAIRLKDKGYSTTAIGRRMGINESSVRGLLDPSLQEKRMVTTNTANILKKSLKDEGGYLNVGLNVERHMNLTETKLYTAVQKLKDEGYQVFSDIKIRQLGTGFKTTLKILAPPGTTREEVMANLDKIHIPNQHTEDHGQTFRPYEPPRSVSSDRVKVIFPDEGGDKADGLIKVRRGVPELSLKDASYVQARIAVNDTHYLKGMVVYGKDEEFPPGKDILFYTSKPKDMPVYGTKDNSVLKPIKHNKYDPENPFGATIRDDSELILAQRHYIDKNGKEQLSCINIVNEEGNWDDWSRTMSSQLLSKQKPALAKKQLDLAYKFKEESFKEIMSLENPAVKAKLLKSFADECDSDAVHLKAAGMPRQASRVILPFNDLHDDEIYAPGFKDGETVVLVRHPYSGPFESPRLTVNNHGTRSKVAREVIGTGARDAIGINYKVAAKMSGADFDGDTVLVIPDPHGEIRTAKTLKGLEDFEFHIKYRLPDDAPKMKSRTKQNEMGRISNLITDMTIQGATPDELERAVKHSMVIIDAEKHHLDYKQSYIDNRILELKKKYQMQIDPETGKARYPAATIISRAKSQARVDERKEGAYIWDEEKGRNVLAKIDPKTGKKLYSKTGRMVSAPIKDKDGKIIGWKKPELAQTKTTQMDLAEDAFTLSSGQPIENVYAAHANRLKDMANRARLELIHIKPLAYNPTAKKTYSAEVKSILEKYDTAKKNMPFENQAQALAGTIVRATILENPGISDEDKKKVRNNALKRARARLGAKKTQVSFSQREWEAIQAGAFHFSTLVDILSQADENKLKELAMPRKQKGISASKLSLARQMINNRGYTIEEAAEHLGISTSTLQRNL